jgi:protease-4
MEKLPDKPKKKRRTWLIVTIVVVVILLLSFIGIAVGAYLLITGNSVKPFEGDSVAVIRLEGVISSSASTGGLLGGEDAATPEPFTDNLKEALEDDSVKAIVIRVNSPGGSPAASQEMYEEVQKAAKKKPVIASIAEVAASGSYYAISPVKEIMAPRAADIGSIGVFIEVPNLEELYKKLGVKMTIIKEGKYKAMGDPSKPLTGEERKILQDYAKEIYNQFIDDVAKARTKLTAAEVRKLATGRTWPATQAKELGLIDSFGDYQDAIKRAAKLGKIKGEPEVITYEEEDWFSLMNSGLKALKNLGSLPNAQKNFK